MSRQEIQARNTNSDGSKIYEDGVVGPSERDRNEVNSLKNFVSDEKGNNTVRNVAIGSAAVLAAGTVGYIATHQTPAEVRPTESPASTVAVKTPQGTAEVTFPPVSASPTAEVKKEVPCFVVEQKYCDKVERVLLPINGVKVQHIGIQDLPPGTPIYAERDGFLDKTKDGDNFLAVIRQETGGTTYRGVLRFENLLSKNVKKGEIIGYIDDKSGYKLLVTDTIRTSSGPVLDEKRLREIYPAAYEKPIKELSNIQGTPVFISHSSTTPSQKP